MTSTKGSGWATRNGWQKRKVDLARNHFRWILPRFDMSISTGIFLGLCVLGLICLYIGTWQRWRWKRIIVGLVEAGGFVPILAFFGWVWVKAALDSRPHVEQEMWS